LYDVHISDRAAPPMSSSEPPPAAVVNVPPSDAAASEKRGQIWAHLDAMERRLDSMNVVAGILLTGFGLLLTIVFKIEFSPGNLHLLGIIPISDDTVNILLFVSVLIPLASGICCVTVLFRSLRLRGNVTLAVLKIHASNTQDLLLSEAHKRSRLVGRNRYFLALTTIGYFFELVLTLALLDISFGGLIWRALCREGAFLLATSETLARHLQARLILERLAHAQVPHPIIVAPLRHRRQRHDCTWRQFSAVDSRRLRLVVEAVAIPRRSLSIVDWLAENQRDLALN
jgi:hypothetical protein